MSLLDPNGKTILLLDDEPLFRDCLRHLLTGKGYNCLEAGEDGYALELLRSNRVDLVIEDLARDNVHVRCGLHGGNPASSHRQGILAFGGWE